MRRNTTIKRSAPEGFGLISIARPDPWTLGEMKRRDATMKSNDAKGRRLKSFPANEKSSALLQSPETLKTDNAVTFIVPLTESDPERGRRSICCVAMRQ